MPNGGALLICAHVRTVGETVRKSMRVAVHGKSGQADPITHNALAARIVQRNGDFRSVFQDRFRLHGTGILLRKDSRTQEYQRQQCSSDPYKNSMYRHVKGSPVRLHLGIC